MGVIGALLVLQPELAKTAAPPVYVVQISVDGLKPQYLQQLLDAGQAPNFAKLKAEGAWTFNARTDYDWTITLPNHTSMLTGRPVNDKYSTTGTGHRWTTNTTPPAGTTLHGNAGYYVASAFDVAHDNGYATGLYASKDKFVVYRDSYDATNGALDVTGADNGRNKIDVYVNNDLNSTAMFAAYLANMNANPTNYTFVHFNDPDTAGHASGWGSTPYLDAVKAVDAKLGQMFAQIAGNALMNGNTTIILSADHGGTGTGHSTQTDANNYVIEMMLRGPNIPANTDLYTRGELRVAAIGAELDDSGIEHQQPDKCVRAGSVARDGDAHPDSDCDGDRDFDTDGGAEHGPIRGGGGFRGEQQHPGDGRIESDPGLERGLRDDGWGQQLLHGEQRRV